MQIEQIYTGCLAEATYYIESNGEVAIIDPLREIAPYLERAEKSGARIKYIFETHFHADFVSGHLDLARETGAQIIFGPTAEPNFEAYIAKENETFKLGDVMIRVLHTPGHTMESSTFLLVDEDGIEQAIFTGDTLFIGDVGRPDLAVKTDLTQEDLAGHLYDSLRNKIMPLPDHVTVYPGHGAGSACGKNMSSETTDSLGNQKLYNYALRADMTKNEFVKEVTYGLVAPPQYFPKNAVMNKSGYDSVDEVFERGLVPLEPKQFIDTVKRNDALILDTRPAGEFLSEHIPGSIWIGIDGTFAPWVGALITDLKRHIVFIAEEGMEGEVVTRLARVGYDYSLGFLQGCIKAWKTAGFGVEGIKSIGAHDFVGLYDTQLLKVLDVRKVSEYDSQHIEGAISFPLDLINSDLEDLDKETTYYLHCQGGYRSVIAASIMKARGFVRIVNVEGGFNEIKKSCVSVTKYKEPVTML